jgi:hypothetical protein
MMLCEFEIANFKGFGDPEKIPVRPITLLYGPNSSGKSSLLHALLLIKQTLEESENPETLLLPKGRLVDLGGYLEFLHRHDPARCFSFRVMLDASNWEGELSRNRSFRLPFLKHLDRPLLGLGVAFKYDTQLASATLRTLDLFAGLSSSPAVTYKQDKIRGGKLFHRLTTQTGGQVSLRSSADKVLRTSTANFDHPLWHALWQRRKLQIMNTGTRYEIKRRLDQLQKRMERYEADTEIDPHVEVPKGVLNRRNRIKQDTEREIKGLETQLERIDNYTFEQAVKDFSTANERSILTCRNFLPVDARSEIEPSEDEAVEFLPDYGVPEPVDPSALTVFVAGIFREFIESIVYLGPLRESPERHYIFSGNPTEQVGKTGKMVPDILFKNRELVQRLNEKLETFGVGYTIEVSSVSAETLALHDAYALSLTDKLTGVTTSILDVGFGISQLLPVIVQSLLAHDKTLLIEQPEIHLHPRLQAELGSLFAETIKPPYNNRFLVETHSEHILLRIQKLIRQKMLKPEDISVVYVDHTPEASKCIPLRIDADGDFIDQWPGGFFEDAYQEIFK